MSYVGVGSVTGIYGVSDVRSAIIVDSSQAFENIKKGVERVTSERPGLTGFRSIVAKQADVTFILVQIPPYPQAVAEAVTELYLFGARRFILIGRGYRLSKKLPPRVALVVRGAVGVDNVSRMIAAPGLPLVISWRMEHVFRSVVELRFQDFNWVYANSVTLPSAHLRYLSDEVRVYAGKRGVVAADTLVAPLYALQYDFVNMEAMAMLTLHDAIDSVISSPVHPSLEDYEDEAARIAREETILYMVALEMLRRLEGVR